MVLYTLSFLGKRKLSHYQGDWVNKEYQIKINGMEKFI